MTVAGSAPDSCGRLAPSPTGLLHLGHARTFLIAWWHARSRGGRLLLRVEDLDAQRAHRHFFDASLADLEWLGLDWDGVPSVQTEHLGRFDAAVAQLLASGAAYPCICSRSDLANAQNAPHAGDSEPRYPGTCRDRFASVREAQQRSGRPAGVRLRIPEGAVTLRDDLWGDRSHDVQAEVGDFLIARRGGAPAYQLAVVVDDAAEGVNEVVRAADLLPSTHRQWHVQRALGLPHPRWAHIPLVTDPSGRRLAKRADDLSLHELRERGADPRAVVRWVAQSIGLGGFELLRAAELTAAFRLDRVPLAEVAVDASVVAKLLEK